MGPRVGDTRMYLFAGVLCSCVEVAGIVFEPCAICSPDVDVWTQLRVMTRSLAGGVVCLFHLVMMCRPSFQCHLLKP